MIEKSDSTSLALATIAILGQAPRTGSYSPSLNHMPQAEGEKFRTGGDSGAPFINACIDIIFYCSDGSSTIRRQVKSIVAPRCHLLENGALAIRATLQVGGS